jgi:DNA-binding LacI/PurR family transcriptional regulator
MSIGVLNFDPDPRGGLSAMTGIEYATRRPGCQVSIVSVPPADGESPVTAAARLRRLGVDGILAIAPQPSALDALAAGAGEVPLVAVATRPHQAVTVVAVDHYSAAATATRHLLGLGHRTVFHIAGPPSRPDASVSAAGWRDALRDAGAEVPAPVTGGTTPSDGYGLGRALAARAELTAVLVANDRMALGVLRALAEAGRRVPEDVSLVGLDGTPEGAFFTPPLTTVQHNLVEMGRRSVELLRGAVAAGRHISSYETIPAELVIRASTAPAP